MLDWLVRMNNAMDVIKTNKHSLKKGLVAIFIWREPQEKKCFIYDELLNSRI